MVRDAEAHEEEDKKFRELVEARNKADALVHATSRRRSRNTATRCRGDDRAQIESALADLRSAS